MNVIVYQEKLTTWSWRCLTPLELEQHNIEVGPFSFQAPGPGCMVANKLGEVCSHEYSLGFPGDNGYRTVQNKFSNSHWSGLGTTKGRALFLVLFFP